MRLQKARPPGVPPPAPRPSPHFAPLALRRGSPTAYAPTLPPVIPPHARRAALPGSTDPEIQARRMTAGLLDRFSRAGLLEEPLPTHPPLPYLRAGRGSVRLPPQGMSALVSGLFAACFRPDPCRGHRSGGESPPAGRELRFAGTIRRRFKPRFDRSPSGLFANLRCLTQDYRP